MTPDPDGWPALVLTAGLGSRLRPLSWVRAKAAVPLAGEPIVTRILRWLAGHGVRRVVLNLHHRPETITAIVGDGSAFGLSVAYSREDPILGSAGGPRHALQLLAADRFFIVNGDTLTDLDPGLLAREHVSSGAKVTLAAVPNPDPAHYGGLDVDEQGWVRQFVRGGAAGPSARLFAGVQAVETSVFAPLPPDVPFETVRQVYPALIAQMPHSIRAHLTGASFLDVGTTADYLAASLALASREGRPSPLVGRNSVVSPTARLVRSVVWDDVEIGPAARLEECVVADGVFVPAGTTATRAVLTREGDGPASPGAVVSAGVVFTPIDAGERHR